MHFTDQGLPDRFGSRQQWLGMVVSTTLLLVMVVWGLLSFLPNGIKLHARRRKAVFLISALFIGSTSTLLILKTVHPSFATSGLLPVLITLFGSGLVYATVPSFLPHSDRTATSKRPPAQQQALQHLYRLSRSVVVRVNALAAPVMLLAQPSQRWSIAIGANGLAFLGLTLLGLVIFRKTNS